MAKILIADDDHAIRDLLKSSLLPEGHQVVTARNGAEALSLADQETPDLIILDLVMPLVDGFETLRLLRRHPPTENTPVIVLTVKSTEQDIAKGWELGADFYLTKPFEIPELLSIVRSLLIKGPTPAKTQEPAPDT